MRLYGWMFFLEDLHREQTHIQVTHFGKHAMERRVIYQ
jgi:hypothetical protein